VTILVKVPDSVDPMSQDSLWEQMPDALLLVDEQGSIVGCNSFAEQTFGCPGSLIGRTVESLMPDQFATGHPALRNGFHDSAERRPMGAGVPLRAKRADGSTFPVNISLSPLDDQMVIAAVRDITEKVETEARLLDATRRRILAEDHERIAREMHDTIIQELFALGMSMQSLIPRLSDETHATRIGAAVDTLDDVIHSIRALIFDIRQTRPADDSLRSKIVDIATSLIPSLGFEPTVIFRGPVDATPLVLHDDLCAAARESLTNVARHAAADTAAIDAFVDDSAVMLRVTDDGVGMPDQATRHSGHANLADRALSAGGEFRVRRHDEGGTLVEWRAPLS